MSKCIKSCFTFQPRSCVSHMKVCYPFLPAWLCKPVSFHVVDWVEHELKMRCCVLWIRLRWMQQPVKWPLTIKNVGLLHVHHSSRHPCLVDLIPETVSEWSDELYSQDIVFVGLKLFYKVLKLARKLNKQHFSTRPSSGKQVWYLSLQVNRVYPGLPSETNLNRARILTLCCWLHTDENPD